jgi:acetyltransferase-like isoleucine patch superfamily enzyme
MLSMVRGHCVTLTHGLGQLGRLMAFSAFRRLLGSAACAEAWRLLGANIDPTALVCSGVWMRFPEQIKIGAGSRLNHVELDSWAPITIGRNTLINEARLLTGSHHIDRTDFEGFGLPITIGDYVWVVRQVTVLPGVAVGDAAVLATGAAVTHDVGDHSVVGGNPAREIKRRADVAFSYVPGAAGFGT